MYKKSGQYGPWLRAPSSKKSTTSSVTNRNLPAAGVVDGNPTNLGRRVKTKAFEERQMIKATDNPDDLEKIMFDHTRRKFDSSLNPGMSCNLRTNQNLSEEAINAFCLTSYDSKQERSLSQVVPLTKPNMSLSFDYEQTWHDFGPIPLEVLRVVKAWSNQPPPLALGGPWNEELISKGFREGPSKIISKVEKQHKGKDIGSRRLSEIKQAARAKFASENARKFDDETGMLEFGRDLFGKRIINIPTFTSSPSLSLTEIEDIQCDEYVKFSLFANDILQCHS
ncbi:hypothetical protein V6N13_111420 [Hibiscus sabdariffa]